MLRAEQTARDSAETQAAYDVYHSQHLPAPEALERQLQRGVLERAGFCTCDASLAAYWRVRDFYVGDEEVAQSVVYLSRTNIRAPIRLRAGDVAPNAPLAHYRDGAPAGRLLDRCRPGRPLVVAAGSYS